MPLAFVIGRAGTGKTHRCLGLIAAELRARPLGPAIFWILPKQATFEAERRLSCETGGYLRARVVSFEQLGREVLLDCGGASIPEVTPLGRQMVLGHLLRCHGDELKFFKDVARQPGLAEKLDVTFAEFERCGNDPGDLDNFLRASATEGATDADTLLDKVHDLRLIYKAYSDYLGQERLDQHQRLLHVLRCLDESTLFRDAVVYVDGFTDFSEHERRVLARLGKVCRRVEITLTMDPRSAMIARPDLLPQETSLFHPVEMAYRRLCMVLREEGTPIEEPPIVLAQAQRFHAPALAAVEKLGLGTAIVYVQRDAQGIEMLEAPSLVAEVDAAARRIQKLLAGGYRLRDVAVLVRDLGQYHDLIHASFAEHGIPYFADRRRETAHHPLLQFVRALLAIAQGGWPHDWLMALLKTGLTGIDAAGADALESFVLEHRIRGEAWVAAEPWAFHRRGVEQEQPDERQSVDGDRRKLIEALQPFVRCVQGNATVKESVAALFGVMTALPVRPTLSEWMEAAQGAGDFELAAEHGQAWTDLVEMFDELVELLGDEAVTAASFAEILETGLEGFELALVPPTLDQVLVGQVDRTRPCEIRAVLVLGLSDGSFPAVPREDSVLSDGDRRELHRRNVDVMAPSERRLLDEQFLAYRAFTCASDFLYLSRARSDAKGRAVAESPFWRRMRLMFRATPTALPAEARDDASLVATPRQLVTGLMRWARQEKEDATWPALYQWVATEARGVARIDRLLRRAWPALSYENGAALTPAVAEALWPNPLCGGAAQLEAFAACPFMHFLRYGLELQPRQEADVSALDLGHVYHHVLQHVVATLIRQRKSWADLGEPHKQRLVSAAVDRIGHALRGEIMLSTARNRYLLNRIERTLGQVIATQTHGAARGRFKPGFARVQFGGESSLLPELIVQTPRRSEVRLSGHIDRIDIHEDGHTVAAIDYRLTDHPLSLAEVYHGLSLQLMTYPLVLESSGQVLAGRKLTPAAAFYVRMLRWLGDVDHPKEALDASDPRFALKAKPRGLIDERIVRDIDQQFQPGQRSEVINAHLKKDGSFAAKSGSDLADGEEFAALLGHVKRRIGELADGILDGEIAVAPYMMETQTPCPACDYRSICRFEGRGYRNREGHARDKVLELVVKAASAEREGSP
jgi:ATP-dependent helicase/nuclease subunit B